jgi:dihydrofolate reductase
LWPLGVQRTALRLRCWRFSEGLDVTNDLAVQKRILNTLMLVAGAGLTKFIEACRQGATRCVLRPSKLRSTEANVRQIIVATFTSLDGIMQAPGGPQEDPTGGFTLGGWTAPYFDEALGASLGEIFGRPFDLLLGRKTYDIFAAHWPYVTDPNDPIARVFNRVTKYVASRSNAKLTWRNSQALGQDIIASLKKLKGEDGPDLLVQGSSDLLQTLWKNGLVDEFSVLIFPVVLGKGKRLFGSGATPVGLKLIKSQSYPTGVIVANYKPDSVVKTGDFQLAEPTEAELERRRKLT